MDVFYNGFSLPKTATAVAGEGLLLPAYIVSNICKKFDSYPAFIF